MTTDWVAILLAPITALVAIIQAVLALIFGGA